ncbi:hypothetical protein TPAR_08269, partial [Tolypocladium paradoxum]
AQFFFTDIQSAFAAQLTRTNGRAAIVSPPPEPYVAPSRLYSLSQRFLKNAALSPLTKSRIGETTLHTSTASSWCHLLLPPYRAPWQAPTLPLTLDMPKRPPGCSLHLASTTGCKTSTSPSLPLFRNRNVRVGGLQTAPRIRNRRCALKELGCQPHGRRRTRHLIRRITRQQDAIYPASDLSSTRVGTMPDQPLSITTSILQSI